MHADETRGLLANLLAQGLSFILSALGYTPANRAGDTFTGNVGIKIAPAVPLHVQASAPAATPAWNAVDSFVSSAATNNVAQLHAGATGGTLAYAFAVAGTRSIGAFGYDTTNDRAFVTTNSVERLRISNAGQHALQTLGAGYSVKEGANAKMGTAVLVGGTVVVNTTAVTANSRIFLTAQTTGAAPGALRVSAVTAGTSFTITSTSATDTSTVAWIIFEPS